MITGLQPVLVLGAGINGCAIARELTLNGVGVWLVDTSDISSGATAGSSRLIHGGLRYLEFGDFELVKESLAERGRLLRLAPQFVRPLRLWIPTASRFGGTIGAIGRFFGWRWWPAPVPKHGRGVSLIRAGLSLYDAYARDPLLPRHRVMRSSSRPSMPIDKKHYRWLCSYYDAQVEFPERLVLAMLADAAQLAKQQGLSFRVLTYHKATLRGNKVDIASMEGGDAAMTFEPSAIINATGAWVDDTLKRLAVHSPRLMGGTKGSHLFTFNRRLHEALGGEAIYAEAPDGRPFFIAPLAGSVLIGTTDEPFDGKPENAEATDREIDYLLNAANAVFPSVRLNRDDVAFHCSAVRPLPHTDARTPAAISRRHALVQHEKSGVPLFSVVGGKLTTMRSLAEMTVARVLETLGCGTTHNSRDRIFSGAENYPADDVALNSVLKEIGERVHLPRAAIAAVWHLVGTRSESILAASEDRELLADCDLPRSFARWSIRNEWVQSLADLVERRLMLLYHQPLTALCLTQLANLLVDAGRLPRDRVDEAVAAEIARLSSRYGKQVLSFLESADR